MGRIGISTDCMCDLPANEIAAKGIEVMQFYIHTATGRFYNEIEITTDNVLEYLAAGNVFLRTNMPETEECRAYFETLLARYDRVVHITTSDKIGLSYTNAAVALERMGEDAKRVVLVNSGSISTGLGHMVLLAAGLRDSGRTAEEIANGCEALRGKLGVSFVMPDGEYLYRTGYMGRTMKQLCALLRLHPVLCTKNGKLRVRFFAVGDYTKAMLRYVRRELGRGRSLDRQQLFVTHAGCPVKMMEQVRETVDSLEKFDRVTVTKASAFIAGCCGPGTVGVAVIYT